jgi:uncharacterized peroxidase-related enzyme
MSRLAPLPPADLPKELQPLLEMADGMMGFVPNDLFIMARNPALVQAMGHLIGAVYGQGTLDPGFKRIIGYITSTASGCVYCQSHTAHGAHNAGIDSQKIVDAWDYETSDLFDDRDRAALRVAQGAGLSPNAVTDEQFADLKNYFSDDEIVEIVGVISMFGFLNRWNATFSTDIEDKPAQFLKGLKP